MGIGGIGSFYLVKSAFGSHINLTADNGFNALFSGGFIKINTAVHNAVVGDSNAFLTEF